MDIEYTKKIVEKALRSDPMTYSVETDDTWVMVRFIDDTFCYLNLQSSLIFYHADNKNPLGKEAVTNSSTINTVKEFVQEIRSLEQISPGGYYTFMFLMKFVELGVITVDMAELIFKEVQNKKIELELSQFYTLLFGNKYQN